MRLSFQRLVAAFRKVKQVQEEMRAYCIAPDRLQLSIEDLHYAVEQLYGLTVEKRLVSFQGVFVRGHLLRYESKALILVREEQEDAWRRFVAVKELCHLVIDENEDWSPEGVKTLYELLAEQNVNSDDIASVVAQSEKLAELAAIELLYPMLHRDPDANAVVAGTSSAKVIAAQHGLPALFVERALNLSYLDLCRKAWGRVPNSIAA